MKFSSFNEFKKEQLQRQLQEEIRYIIHFHEIFFMIFIFFRRFPVFSTQVPQLATCTWPSSSLLTLALTYLVFTICFFRLFYKHSIFTKFFMIFTIFSVRGCNLYSRHYNPLLNTVHRSIVFMIISVLFFTACGCHLRPPAPGQVPD